MQPTSLPVTPAAKRGVAAPAPVAPALTLAADVRMLACPGDKMTKRRGVILGVILGFLAGAIAVVALLLVPGNHPWSWNNMTLGVTDPNCGLVWHWRLKGFFPPSEYDRGLTVIIPENGKKMTVRVPGDPGGMWHVPVYVLAAEGDKSGSMKLVMLLVNDGAVLVDPSGLRVSQFQLVRPDLANPDDMALAQGIASDDWGEKVTFGQWCYVASFDRDKFMGGWGVVRYELPSCGPIADSGQAN